MSTRPPYGSHAQNEAHSLLTLLENGESVESLRQLIGAHDDYRRAVGLHFDVFIAHLSPRDGRLLRNARQNQISAALKKEMCKLLSAGWTHSRIRAALPVGYRFILELSKTLHAPTLKLRGRGRRFTPALREQIRAAVAAGRRSADIERELQVDYDTVKVFRNAIGDFENRRFWKKLSQQQIDEATTALKSGRKWRSVALDSGVSLATLQRWVIYRKRKHRPEPVRTNG